MKGRSTPIGVILVALLAAWFTMGRTDGSVSRQDRSESGRSLVFPDVREAGYGESTEGAEAGGIRVSGPYRVSGVSVVDINTGRSINLGTVDLQPELKRIAAGEKHPHRNDGSVFRNAGRQLPNRPSGYYREYVVPTPGVRGPGPQRLVLGREGEIYYTADHYETFLRIDEGG